MDERFLPADDPVLEEVLNWTIDRDATDIRKLLEWLPQARSSKERKALLLRVNELLSELEAALDGLETLHCVSAMYTALILAGGSSVRMGRDKAFLEGGVERITNELKKDNCKRIIVLCGTESRVELFSEECWPDPSSDMSVADILLSLIHI